MSSIFTHLDLISSNEVLKYQEGKEEIEEEVEKRKAK
jgi:hypothetical protein